MSEYKDMTLAQFADAARASNPELGAIGSTLVDYRSGSTAAIFDNHEGEGAEDTALFLASAREIVLELVRRNIELQEAAKPIAIMSDLLDAKHKPDDEIVSVGVWTEPVPGWVSQFDAWLKLSALDFRKLARLVINRT